MKIKAFEICSIVQEREFSCNLIFFVGIEGPCFLLILKGHFFFFFASCTGDIQKVHLLKISEFWPLPPCSFLSTPPPPPPHTHTHPKIRSFWPELTLSPSMSILVKFKERKLIMSASKEIAVTTLNCWSWRNIIYNQWISSHFCWKCAKKIMDSAEKRTKSCEK